MLHLEVKVCFEICDTNPNQTQFPPILIEHHKQVRVYSPRPYARVAGRGSRYFLTKSVLKSRSASASPLSVRTTDFALLTGLSMRPFSCRRFRESQSKPFQALHSSCSARYSSAKSVGFLVIDDQG